MEVGGTKWRWVVQSGVEVGSMKWGERCEVGWAAQSGVGDAKWSGGGQCEVGWATQSGMGAK